MKQKTLLFYNDMFGEFPDIPENIPSNIKLTQDHEYLYTAHAVVFHLPSLKYIAHRYKPKGQIWVAWCLESDVNCPAMGRSSFMDLFDLTMTYRLDSDIPYTYLYPEYQSAMKNLAKPKSKGINAFISSSYNKSGRVEYLKNLMEHLNIDSYGRIFNNYKIPSMDHGKSTKEALLPDYKFTIAFENSISEDYVTEKFFQPLAFGSVPIYLGAPNINDFAPGENCFINVKNYKTPQELAEYIKVLERDDALYGQYFEWKKKPYGMGYRKLMAMEHEHPFVRLCKLIDRLNV